MKLQTPYPSAANLALAQSSLNHTKLRPCILKSAKLPHSNITKQETKAIKSLKQDNSITILPVDKGRTTVIMDTDTYKQQLTNMPQDRNISKILKKDSTEQKKRTLKTLLKPLLGTNKITQEAYNHLIPTANVTPRIYGTPKIHKKDTPLRPVVDSIGSVTYNLSKALVEIIKPLLGTSKHHCKNSKQLAQELNNITVQNDDMFISNTT
uniref:Uncharacterized protein n=1 Tax=Amphiprion percula TaxID=161767 RepID=A0A3P8S1J5_AMPPE